jgi:hypothetical protein
VEEILQLHAAGLFHFEQRRRELFLGRRLTRPLEQFGWRLWMGVRGERARPYWLSIYNPRSDPVPSVIPEALMTEQEWLHSNSPRKLLAFLRSHSTRLGGRINLRTLRLFTCACWRSAPDYEVCRYESAVEAVEQLADGKPSGRLENVWGAAESATEAMASLAGGEVFHPERVARFCELLRDVFGNPFHPVAVQPAWLSRDVRAVAEAAYRERRLPAGTLVPEQLSILADALEDAGCTEARLLDHLREPGPHVRGCWPIDSLLAMS